MIKVIKNGTVITMDEKREHKYENVDIAIKDDTIISITSNYTGDSDLVIDARGKIVMPGLINAHTHLGMSVFRATNDNLNLNDWLTKKIWPLEEKMTESDFYYSALLSCIEMIKTGTVMANHMYFDNEGCLKAIKDSKVRVLFGKELNNRDDDGDDRIEKFREIYQSNKDNPLIKFAVAPHAFYSCSKDYLKKCSDLALDLDLPLHIHFAENLDEVKNIEKEYKKDIVDALDEVGFLRNKLILAHATFISEEGLIKLKDRDVSFVHNPVSNLNLGCGIANITKYREYVNICLGTDGQGSGNNLNMFYHLSLVDLLQEGLYKNPTIFSSYDVLKMATVNGAKALGVDDITGSIEVGKKADIIILDMNNIEVYPTVDLINNVVHNTSSNNVNTTIINGEILMYNHKLTLKIDLEKLKQQIDLITNRVITKNED